MDRRANQKIQHEHHDVDDDEPLQPWREVVVNEGSSPEAWLRHCYQLEYQNRVSFPLRKQRRPRLCRSGSSRVSTLADQSPRRATLASARRGRTETQSSW